MTPALTDVLLSVEPVLAGAVACVCIGSQDAPHYPHRELLHLILQLHHPALPLLLPKNH